MCFEETIKSHLKRHEARFTLAPLIPQHNCEWKMYLPSKSVVRSVRKATSADEYAPKRKHIRNVILSTYTHSLTSLSPKLISSITSIPLAYTPPTHSLSTLGDVASPMGNSIHNSTSTAGLSIRYHGLSAFKALTIVHSMLHEGPKPMVQRIHESGELRYWMNSLIRDVKWGVEGERGYGFIAAAYAKYLMTRINTLDKLDLGYDLSPILFSDRKHSLDLIETTSHDTTSINGTALSSLDDSSREFRLLIIAEMEKSTQAGSGCRGAALALVEKDFELWEDARTNGPFNSSFFGV